MQNNCILRNRKAKACSAHLSRSRLVNTVKPVIDFIEILLRNTDTGVRYGDSEILVIRINGNLDLSVILIVLDGIFNQVCESQ